jgi:hypothetical protein
MYSRIDDHSYFFFFSKCIAIVLQNNQTEQEIYVIFGIILTYKSLLRTGSMSRPKNKK